MKVCAFSDWGGNKFSLKYSFIRLFCVYSRHLPFRLLLFKYGEELEIFNRGGLPDSKEIAIESLKFNLKQKSAVLSYCLESIDNHICSSQCSLEQAPIESRPKNRLTTPTKKAESSIVVPPTILVKMSVIAKTSTSKRAKRKLSFDDSQSKLGFLLRIQYA